MDYLESAAIKGKRRKMSRQDHAQKVIFVQKHKDLFMEFRPWKLGWNLNEDPIGQRILYLVEKELNYSPKTYKKDILLSLMRMSRGCDLKLIKPKKRP